MDKIKLTSYTNQELVVQANSLIDAPRNFSLLEQKVFLFLIAKMSTVNPAKDNPIIRIFVKDFAQAVGTKGMYDTYRDIRRVMRSIQGRTITIQALDNNIPTTIDLSLFYYVQYWNTLGYVDIQFHPMILPYITALTKEFTTFKLANIISMRSKYSIRLFEILYKYKSLKQRVIQLDQLRYILCLEHSFSQYKELRRNVIDIAVSEINSKTDITVKYIPIKTGRKITAIKFIISQNSSNKSTPISSNKNAPQSFGEIFNVILEKSLT